MAALSQSEDNSDCVTSSPRKENELFMPKETPDQRCDVILVVEDGKEFKAHKQVLSEASPFFEKLLNSDMKESREGIVRLEMFSESAMRNTLQFIYTSDVPILAEENAQDLVVSADYLFLPGLKTLAEAALVKMLNTSNCISVYHVSQRYQCEELLAKSKKCILANFNAVYETNREEVLNMSSKEMEMWLSSDEINVGAEEDVFKIILAWIDHDRYKRQKYFAELFGHVRVVFVSRDFLPSDILKSDLVKDNECCLNRVVDAINLIDSQNYGNLSIAPRKSLETSVMVVISSVTRNNSCKQNGQPILCYFPGEGRWCKLGEMPRQYPKKGGLIFRRGKLHSLQHRSLDTLGFASYDLYSYSVSVSGLPDICIDFAMVLEEIFVVNDDEIYALVCGRRDVDYRVRRDVRSEERRKCIYSIIKYKQDSNSWEDVTSLDHLPDARYNVCIVAKDDFVYFIGGKEWIVAETGVYEKLTLCTDVYRYNISRNQWDRVADILRPKMDLSGAACNGRIFITGKVELGMHETSM
ncbi:kelch-like protein 2 [Orbicella faveolata]|uniref:kelch-like protein 2 n=1 Tax=Orbicella faveolata TaxID=48498 RepID=UPI0009E591F6|nr:kelch-like protein 2 [Orbicella faveolata]